MPTRLHLSAYTYEHTLTPEPAANSAQVSDLREEASQQAATNKVLVPA